MNPAQPKHAEIPEHGPSREPRGAARRHLVTPDQKMPHALIDVIVDRSIGRQARPVPDQTDNCLGGSFLHWCYAPSGHTEKYRIYERTTLQQTWESSATFETLRLSNILRN